jgi:thiol-disulfide isomerase/thioredoxin
LGTWCGDSKEQVPRFIRILDELKYKTGKISFLCVDRQFKDEKIIVGNREIEKVPTIIIYRKKKNLGKIIEIPMLSLEKDLLEILSKPL